MPDTTLKIRLTPRGSRNEILGWEGDTLRVKITAPPVEGAANKACVEFLADRLRVKRAQVSIIAGDKSRDKTLKVNGLTANEVRSIIGI
jgi:uncharacterized protein